MNGRQASRGLIRQYLVGLLTVLGVITIPVAPCVQRSGIQRRLANKTYGIRMYVVGVINKLAKSLCGRAVLVPAASSIVSILKVWKIPRSSTLFRSDQRGLLACLTESPSQMGQDALAVVLCGSSPSKYFVEAGACDGLFSSNTWILESRNEWNGLLAEPGRVWHGALMERRRCRIDTRALWTVSGETLKFRQTELPNLSTLEGYSDGDMHSVSRQRGTRYDVTSVSLQDLLRENDAPKYVDFLSLDTEGTEFEILREFPFAEFSFGLIVCEHNNTESLESIRDLLTAHDYIYLNELACISLGDAWFVGPQLQFRLNQLRAGHKKSSDNKLHSAAN